MSDKFRLVRLVGDGDTSGGGLPLPDAFTAVLQELLDNGPGNDETMVKVIRNALSYKEKRVLVTWTTWEDFARDVLAQLQEAGFIEPTLGKWYLGTRFVLRERMVVIPEKNIGVIIYPPEERKQLNAVTKVKLELRRTEARTAAWLTDAGLDDTLVHTAIDALVVALDGEPAEMPVVRRKKTDRRPTGVIAAFTEQYLLNAYPRRITSQEIASAFNEANPDPERGKVKSGVIVQKLNKMRGEGTALRFDDPDDHGRRQVLWVYDK